MTPSQPLETDVLIVGGGPVGLTLAYQLALFSQPSSTNPNSKPISVHVVEKYPKPVQSRFGRAVTFWPRSMELLSQIGIGDDICQQCVAVRSSAAYNTKGEEVFGRGWSFLEGIEDTRFKFASVLRQKYVEEILRRKLDILGVKIEAPVGFVGLRVDESVSEGEMGRVIATVRKEDEGEEGEEYEIKCRYLIGCDGSRTLIRGAAGIDSVGDRTEDKWVRIDGVLKSTSMPKPRSYGAIESPIYGNVLWIPLDHGATRIGFALNEKRRKLYDELNEEVFIKEAKLSVAPFEIEYERVDWASVYSVGQRVAKQFWTSGCIFLAGDSCHTHSSGAGQGMNAGVHDATNLGWKLALVLQGRANPELLETYDLERRPNAERLIKYDEDISVLVTGRLPKSWKGDPAEDPNIALGKILQEAKGFNTGLTIGYEPNLAVLKPVTQEVNGDLEERKLLIPAPAIPGCRAPDVRLLSPALWQEVWLQQLTPNRARFYVVVFVGTSDSSRENFKCLRDGLINSKWTLETALRPDQESEQLNGNHDASSLLGSQPVDYVTILPKAVANPWHELGTDPLGQVYYDDDGSAGRRYGIDQEKGTIFILRPDGWIGAKLDLSSSQILGYVDGYLSGILISR